jgi:hypothetical protein
MSGSYLCQNGAEIFLRKNRFGKRPRDMTPRKKIKA